MCEEVSPLLASSRRDGQARLQTTTRGRSPRPTTRITPSDDVKKAWNRTLLQRKALCIFSRNNISISKASTTASFRRCSRHEQFSYARALVRAYLKEFRMPTLAHDSSLRRSLGYANNDVPNRLSVRVHSFGSGSLRHTQLAIP